MNRIICIGTRCNPKQNRYTGQSVMFDGIVDKLSNNNKVTVIDIISRFKSKSPLLRSMEYVMYLAKLFLYLLVNKYDICYVVTSQSKNGFLRDYAMIMLCKRFHVPVIVHQFGANYKQLTDSLGSQGLPRLIKMLNYVSAIIVEGKYMKEQYSFLESYDEKVKVIPNGLPVEGKHANNKKVYNGTDTFIIFYLSNLIWSKGYYDVLQSVDILVNKEQLDVKCIFAGKFISSVDDVKPGICNKVDFDKFIVDHGLVERVEYYPGLYGDEKDKYFYNSNVFVLPTYYINEGQPVSVIEAMAYGCVPIVTKFRHIPMMVNEANGCFVEPKSPEDIAIKVKYLMKHSDDYATKSKNCIKDYHEKFVFDVFVEKVMKCIKTVIS